MTALAIADHTITVASEVDARDLVAKLTAWLDAPRLAACLKPEVVAADQIGKQVLDRNWTANPATGEHVASTSCDCGARATMGARCMACASRESE